MICPRNEFMSTDCYQMAYEHATHEIAEINAQIERLTRRKELLEKLLQPLELLVPESGSVQISASVSDGSNTEFTAPERATQASPVTLVVSVLEPESGSLEALAPLMQSEVEEANIRSGGNSESISHEDVAGLAYRFWNERGQLHGHHEEDWFKAAHELQNSDY